MASPEYLVSYLYYSRNIVQGIHKVVGETDKYYKCLLSSRGESLYIRKSNLIERGGTTKYYPWTEAQVDEYWYRNKLLNKVKSLNPSLLSTKQLEEILKIAEGGENAIQSNE